MKFYSPYEFEIPDEWWVASGMTAFQVDGQCYPASSNPEFPTKIVAIAELVVPPRAPLRMFDQVRMIDVLRGIAGRAVMPPVPVHSPPTAVGGQLHLRDGFHRFHASAAAGFTHLPVTVFPFFDING
jgi:hypothetical protein